MRCLDINLQLQLIEGQLPDHQQQALAEHLQQCTRCAALRQDLADISDGLGRDPAEFGDPDLVEDVLTLVRLGQAERPTWRWSQPRRWVYAMVASGVALLVVLATFWIWQSGHADPTHTPSEFVARSGSTSNLDRWVSIALFRATQNGYVPVNDVLTRGDGLAFSYVMRTESGYGYLMIFALDQTGQIYWYYPASHHSKEAPESISVSSTQLAQSLPHEVKHDLRPGPLRFFALFSQQPLQLGYVEQMVLAAFEQVGSLDKIERLPIPQTGQQSLLVQVKDN